MRPIIACALLLVCSFAAESPAESPATLLRPLKLESPRDTFKSYITAMQAYRAAHAAGKNTLALSELDKAARSFNLEHLPVLTRRESGRTGARLLQEVLDRVIRVDLSRVPDDPSLSRWRLKDTDIVIQKELSGDDAGRFLFSQNTVQQLRDFYERVKHLPYLEDTGGGAHYREPWQREYIPAWAQSTMWGVPLWKYLGLLLGVFLGLVLKRLLVSLLRAIRGGVLPRIPGPKQYAYQMWEALERPMGLVGASAFWFACVQAMHFEGKLLSFLVSAVQISLSVAVIGGAYRLVGVLQVYLQKLAQLTQSDLDDHMVPLVTRSLRIFLVLVGSLFALQNLGFNILSLLAGLGLGGLAFALAAKDTVANVFGSLMIIIDQPFRMGDWIRTPSVEGTVEHIGFRSTRVRTFYQSVVSIPNSSLANENIDNMGLRPMRRVKGTIGLVYSTPTSKIQEFVEGVREIISSHPQTDHSNYHVYFNNYGASSLDVMLYFFLQVPDWSEELKQKGVIYSQILDLAKKLNVQFAFPSRSIYMQN